MNLTTFLSLVETSQRKKNTLPPPPRTQRIDSRCFSRGKWRPPNVTPSHFFILSFLNFSKMLRCVVAGREMTSYNPPPPTHQLGFFYLFSKVGLFASPPLLVFLPMQITAKKTIQEGGHQSQEVFLSFTILSRGG